MRAAAAAGAALGAWRPAEDRAQGLPSGPVSDGDVNLKERQRRAEHQVLVEAARRVGPGLPRGQRAVWLCHPCCREEKGRGFSYSLQSSAPVLGKGKGKLLAKSTQPPRPRFRNRTRPQLAHPLQETVLQAR